MASEEFSSGSKLLGTKRHFIWCLLSIRFYEAGPSQKKMALKLGEELLPSENRAGEKL